MAIITDKITIDGKNYAATTDGDLYVSGNIYTTRSIPLKGAFYISSAVESRIPIVEDSTDTRSSNVTITTGGVDISTSGTNKPHVTVNFRQSDDAILDDSGVFSSSKTATFSVIPTVEQPNGLDSIVEVYYSRSLLDKLNGTSLSSEINRYYSDELDEDGNIKEYIFFPKEIIELGKGTNSDEYYYNNDSYRSILTGIDFSSSDLESMLVNVEDIDSISYIFGYKESVYVDENGNFVVGNTNPSFKYKVMIK